MTKRILVLLGHPDPSPERFGAALASAYVEAASKAGHTVRRVDLSGVDTPLLTNQTDFATRPPLLEIKAIQDDILWAEHVVIVFPLWLGSIPAKLKALLEQVFCGGFGFEVTERSFHGLLRGRSARLVVTMGMPAIAFWLMFGGHGLLALDKSILAMAGMKPIRKTVIGGVEAIGDKGRLKWLARMRRYGEAGV
jgi:putative NADPH-quinone reductase